VAAQRGGGEGENHEGGGTRDEGRGPAVPPGR
jgi:hypothetical protein